MRPLLSLLIVCILTLIGCHSDLSKTGKLVESVNKKVSAIDQSHRLQIIDDDFVEGDTLFKIRGYYQDRQLLKLIGITKTTHFERDDYFYFEGGKQLFSGHMMNFRDDRIAEEFKYYFENGSIKKSLMWKDTYTPGKRFPHETFKSFSPNLDSLMKEEKQRVAYFSELLNKEGRELLEQRENLEAN
ncbi:MAG: hypothetical protein RIF46_10225 [Cyclobacteriaceae bacterium]